MILLAALLPAQPGKTGEAGSTKSADASKGGQREGLKQRIRGMQEAMRIGEIRIYNVYVRLRLKNKNKLKGIVRNGRFVEVHNGLDFVAADRGHRGSGLRLWYTAGTDGFLFVPYSEIESYEVGRTLTDEQIKTIEQDLVSKRVLVSEKYRRIVTEKKAARSRAPAGQPAARPPQAVPALTAEQAALLKEFPAAEGWGASKLEELKRRRVVVGVYPNDKEQRFESVYAEWAKALAADKAFAAAKSAEQDTGGVTPPVNPGSSKATGPSGLKPRSSGAGSTVQPPMPGAGK